MDLFDLAGFKTARADLHFLYPTAYACPHRTQVRVETPTGQIMGVRYVMAEHRLLAAIIANSGQSKTSKTIDLHDIHNHQERKYFLTIFYLSK
jgi:hypothetical protein